MDKDLGIYHRALIHIDNMVYSPATSICAPPSGRPRNQPTRKALFSLDLTYAIKRLLTKSLENGLCYWGAIDRLIRLAAFPIDKVWIGSQSLLVAASRVCVVACKRIQLGRFLSVCIHQTSYPDKHLPQLAANSAFLTPALSNPARRFQRIHRHHRHTVCHVVIQSFLASSVKLARSNVGNVIMRPNGEKLQRWADSSRLYICRHQQHHHRIKMSQSNNKSSTALDRTPF